MDPHWPTTITRLTPGQAGEPVRMIKDKTGAVVAFDMIFYGQPGIVKNVPSTALDQI